MKTYFFTFTLVVLLFGSAFWDMWNNRNSLELVAVGFEKAYLSSGLGLAINKYRFSDNLLFEKNVSTGQVTWQTDPDPAHDYVNTFFGYGKSKLVQASIYIPLYLNLMVSKNVQITAGGFIDYPFVTTKLGIHAGIYHKEWEMGMGATYYLTAMFEDGMGPELHEW